MKVSETEYFDATTSEADSAMAVRKASELSIMSFLRGSKYGGLKVQRGEKNVLN